jgi:hypothetical protein
MAFLPIPGLFTAVYCRLSRTFFLAPCSLDMAELAAVSLVASLVFLALAVLPLPASAWNIPHMLSAAITYQVLSQENPRTIEKVKTLLEKHPWYANQWQTRLQDVSGADRDMGLFIQAARWADDIRSWDKAQKSTAVALHQPAIQARRSTTNRTNQRSGASEHPNRVG